jgi:hypothetical protein
MMIPDRKLDVLLWLKPKDFNPIHDLCGRRAELRFTVRRPASAEVSPCCHRPSGGDVACSVHVGVARPGGAGFALENRLALAVSGSDVPARRASLRRVRGRDLLDPTESFVPQTCSQKPPTTAVDSPVGTALLSNPHTRLLHGSARRAGHRAHVKGFDADCVEAPRNIRRGLFDPVLTSVSLTCPQLCDRQLGASSPVGAALGAGQALLQHLQPLRLPRSKTGCVQQLPGRQCRRHRNTTVDTHHAALTRASDRIRRVDERDVPAAGPVAGDPVGLHSVRDRTRQAKPHPADLRHPHPTEPAVQTPDVMGFHRDLPKSFMHTGFTPRRAAVGSGEEVAHRLGEVPQRLLLHGLRPVSQPIVLGTRRSQLNTLLVVARRTPPRLPVLVLLNGQVPHIPGVATMLAQHRRLFGSRKQPISRHTGNLTTTTDKTPKLHAASPPPATARDRHAATSR